MAQAKKKAEYTTNGATLGFEAKLWQMADKLRSNMDAAEYKHVVLGLIFLKYISDAFTERRTQLERNAADPDSEWYVRDPDQRYEVLEDRDEYLSDNVFWVPKEARWSYLQARAKQPDIGVLVDHAMDAIERENPTLKGVLPRDYARPALDKRRLGELIDLIGTIGLGDAENRSLDILGKVYEYFLGMFADAEGKRGGEFFTPTCVVRTLVALLAPFKGRVYDPCCGSGGMFVQSEQFIEAHGGRLGDISIFGQESNPTTWRLCRMNLAIRGIDADLGQTAADSFLRDLHPDLKSDYILANPPFNMSDWGGDRLGLDVRWKYGVPPISNANYAWVQHFIHHLAPNGIAGFVLANGSMSSNQSGEGDIRRAIIEADLVDCMVALPGQLFRNTQIPVCLWFVARNKANGRGLHGVPLRNRSGETLFIDARKLGSMTDRTHREFTDEDIARIADTYHAWRGDLFLPLPLGEGSACMPLGEGKGEGADPWPGGEGKGKGEGEGAYQDIPGFCYAATLDDIRANGFILTPGRYVGAEEIEDDGEPFEDKMERLTARLQEQFAESARLEQAIRENLRGLGYGE